jgi:mono/diheme cytochrome c family protein
MIHPLAIVPRLLVMPLLLVAGCRSDAVPTPVEAPAVAAASDLEAGRYLVEIGGCNDCHSVGYIEANGALADSLWLTGSPVGFRGPWGTSYAKNLRLTTHQLTEDQWVARLQAGGLPPMPWPSVRALSDADARAIYRFVRSLGPAGGLAPRPVGPDVEPATPYLDFVPQHLDGPTAPADSAAS